MKNASVRIKLMFAMLAISLTGMLVVAGIGNLGARSLILKETLRRIKSDVSYEAGSISGWLDAQKMLVKTAGSSLILENDRDAIKEYCRTEDANNPQLLDMYMGFSDDTAIFGKSETPEGWKATQRPWYKAAMAAKGEVVVTEPYQDSQTGKMCITVTQYAGTLDGLDAVMAIDVEIGTLLEMVSAIRTADGGYAFLADQNGLIITHPLKKYNPSDDKAFSMLNDPVYTKAYQNRNEESVKLTDYDDTVRYFVPFAVASSGWVLYEAEPEQAIFAKTNNQILLTLLMSAVIMLIAALIIRTVILHIIVRPVAALTDAADHIIEGDLDITIVTKSNDEIGKALQAFGNVKHTIERVIHDLETMSIMHKEGDFEYRLNEAGYDGDYKHVASGVNSMVAMYVENLSGIMNLLQKVSMGDFNAQVRRYPGKQAVYNEIIESFRSELVLINKEISHLGEAAADGNLAVRADTTQLQGGWLKMATGLNHMLNAVSEPIKESAGVLAEMSKGNFSVRVNGDFKGDFALIKDSVNHMSVEISSYLSEINQVLNEIANRNDLSVHIKRDYIGDFISIKDSINGIVGTLNQFMSHIENAADQVSNESKQVSDSAGLLAQGSTEQANAVSELTQTVDSIDQNTRQNADSAKTANNLSAQSKENAFKASGEMTKMLHSIQEIKDASQNISKIINAIEEIAFQTNLLSLNAAIEAARAGENGKGFAVVAEEVRMLAARSQSAAEETNHIIEDTLSKVNEGVETAENMAESLDTIITDVEKVSQIVDQIYNSSQEQSAAVSEVAAGLKQISGVVMSNNTTSEEMASSSEELSGQSELLKDMINVFKLK